MDLSERMKQYENVNRSYLPRRSFLVIRVDGRSFKNFTQNLDRPFDSGLVQDMNSTALYLCKNIQNAKLAYVQSDEISIILSDFDENETQSWFDNNIQKMSSISASLATSKFNQLRTIREMNELFDQPTNLMDVLKTIEKLKLAEFDSRVFQIPSRMEVMNYLIFRQQDATRNSISSVAQSIYSHKELEKKSGNQKQEMIFQKGINWNDYDPGLKRGRIVFKEKYVVEESERTRWIVQGSPIFTVEEETINRLIPVLL